MSGQKQKRPYKHKPILIADEASVPESVLPGYANAEQIGQVTSVEVIGQDDQGFAVTMSANSYQFGMGEMPKGGFILNNRDGGAQIVANDYITPETVFRVESAIGRTSNAWGMVDPLELIRAVDRVLRG